MRADSTPVTREEFTEALARLVRETESNGVDLEGGYTLRNDGDQRDLEVQIVQLAGQPVPADD
ncbi:hypothetical protein [Haloarchaeobius sp. DT45]|uniref:hypothetical protein n=1 Tax=Haloarchaeobius sp. DT45 TaxID=3446116 RepID=UPI003F6AF873